MTDFIRIIDVETTGMDADDEVCEIASIDLIVPEQEVTMPVHHLVKPVMPIPPTASAIHHITNNMVSMCLPFEEVIDAYKGAPNYAAHNAKFDAMFVGKELGGIQICTLKCAYAAWPEAPGYGNQVLRYWLDLPPPPHEFGHAHRALYDVWCTAHILLKLFEQGWTVDRMIDVSTQPRTLRVVPFGKHRGTAWADLDAGYLQWMSRTGGWDEDVAHTLKKELERRRG